MIFCGGRLLMPFCWLAYPRSGRLHVWLLGFREEVLRRQTWWSRVCVFVVMCLLGHGVSLSLSLWPHCVVEGNNKAATIEALPEARRTNSCSRLSCFQLGTGVMETWHGNISQRGVVSAFKMVELYGTDLTFFIFSFLNRRLCETYYRKMRHESLQSSL